MARAIKCYGNNAQKETWAMLLKHFRDDAEIAPVDDGEGRYIFEYVEDGVMRAGYIEVDGTVTYC